MRFFAKSMFVLSLVSIGVAVLLSKQINSRSPIEQVDYTSFLKYARDQRIVGAVRIRGTVAYFKYRSPASREPVTARTQLPEKPDQFMHQELLRANVNVYHETSFLEGIWGNLLMAMVPVLAIVGVWMFFLYQTQKGWHATTPTSDPSERILRRKVIEAIVEEKLKTVGLMKDEMTPDEVQVLFESCGALLSGHFLLTSGLHSPHYLEKFTVLQHPELTTRLCGEIARRFGDDQVDVVVGPATGGIVLAHEVGRQLGVRAIFTERENGLMALRRGFQIAGGERVLVVEDVVTTGGSVQEVLDLVDNLGGTLVGVALLCDRSGGLFQPPGRLEALMTLAAATYLPADCPQCKAGEPLTERGSRHVKA